MPTSQLVSAAQYLRMSTEHQQYSLENQAAAIQNYAAEHGFVVTHTYEDAGKSGLRLDGREGLKQLLQDVLSGDISCQAILVYDVSRWGRFQDIDEAAHYEFLCRSAGIPVIYCAEPFPNDTSLPSMILKALKRMMAGEYSRELSTKVYAGAKRLAELGFRQGGIAGYGYRRMLVSPTREPKQILLRGERKNIREDRVILVQGPERQVECVREIFRLFTEEGKWPGEIAEELNQRGVPYEGGTKRDRWYAQAVNRILRHPKYAGYAVYGQRCQALRAPNIAMPRSSWTLTPRAWTPIVDQVTFERAQQRFLEQPINRSDAELLEGLRKLWREKGELSERLLNSTPELPSTMAYAYRFGSLTEAFALIGYIGQRASGLQARRKTLALRDKLVRQIVYCATGKVSVVRRDGHFGPRLRLPDHSLVSVEVVRAFRTRKGELRWALDAHRHERDFVTLIARLNSQNDGFEDFYLLPDLKGRTRWAIKPEDPGLGAGKRLLALVDFVAVAQSLSQKRAESAEEPGQVAPVPSPQPR